MRFMKRNPSKNSHVLMWLVRLRTRRKKITEQAKPKEQEKTILDGVLETV